MTDDELKGVAKAGWRCCTDHLLKPEHPCPICRAEELGSRVNFLMEENDKLVTRAKQLESLLGRIHKATAQFYQAVEPKSDHTPYQDIIDLYHDMLPMLPEVRKLTDKRKRALRARWRDDLPTLGDWGLYFEDVRAKPFLLGRNDRKWVADIDFLLREDTIAKMQEGKYDGKARN